MKIKYTFIKVKTASDTVTIESNGIEIMKFKKADFGNDFTNLVGNSYDIGRLDCNNLKNLSSTGAEIHIPSYTDETNKLWKEFTHNIIGSRHFKDDKWLIELDNSSDIVIYNQDKTPTNLEEFKKLIFSIPFDNLPEDSYVDLSNLKWPANTIGIAGFNTSSTSFGPWTKENATGNELYNGNFNLMTKVSKSPQIPEPVNANPYGCMYAGTALTETPFIPNGVYKLTNAFRNCKRLTKITNLPSGLLRGSTWYNADYTNAFKDCTALEEVGDIEIGHVSHIIGMFDGCQSLKKVGNIIVTDLDSFDKDVPSEVFLGSSIEEVGDIKLLYGRGMFQECSTLEKVGDISVNYSFMMFYNCKNLKEIGEVVPYGTEAQCYERMFQGCSSLEYAQVPSKGKYFGGMYEGCTNLRGISLTGVEHSATIPYFPLNIAGNTELEYLEDIDYIKIDVMRHYSYGLVATNLENIGVINFMSKKYSYVTGASPNWGEPDTIFYGRHKDNTLTTPMGMFAANSIIYNIAALPYYYNDKTMTVMFSNKPLPSSTGFSWWVDYIAEENDAVKNITKQEINYKLNFSTENNRDTVTISLASLLEAVDEYPHEFILKEITNINSSTVTSYSNIDSSTVAVSINEDNTGVDVKLDCTNIADNSISKAVIRLDVDYIATITISDVCYEFHGRTKISCNIEIKCAIDEDILIDAKLYNDDDTPIILSESTDE